MKKQKEMMSQQFEEIRKERDELAYAQEEIKKRQKEYEARIRAQMEDYIKESHVDREVEKAERKAVHTFV